MRLLVAIKSCERDMRNGCHEAIRQTWAKDFPQFLTGRDITVDVRYFVGNGNESLRGDEIRVPVIDDLVNLPLKLKEMAAWSVAQDYDYTFFCDTDTYVKPDRLLDCGFEPYDYLGYFGNGYPPGVQIKEFRDGRLGVICVWAYASGGAGYFLSKAAATEVGKMVPANYGEDVSVGWCLGPIIAEGKLKGLAHQKFNDYVVWHYCNWGHTRYDSPNSIGFNPAWMYDAYRKGQPW